MTAPQTPVQVVHPRHLIRVQVLHRIHPVRTPRLIQIPVPTAVVLNAERKRKAEPEVNPDPQKMIEKNRQTTKVPVLTTKVKKASETNCKNIWPRPKNAEGRVENDNIIDFMYYKKIGYKKMSNKILKLKHFALIRHFIRVR